MPGLLHGASTWPPFDDLKVREAFRLIPDRQALINGALCRLRHARQRPLRQRASVLRRRPGRARAGPREGEVAAQGGRAREPRGHAADLRRSCPGFVEAATLFARAGQGRRASPSTSRRRLPNAYFDTSLLYTKIDFGAVLLDGRLARQLVRAGARSPTRSGTRRTCAGPVVRRADPRGAGRARRDEATDALARGAADPVRRGRLHRLGEPEHRRCRRNNVKGIVPSAFFNLGGWNYRDVWLEGALTPAIERRRRMTARRRPRGRAAGGRRAAPSARAFRRPARRGGIVTLFVVSILVFVGTEMLPGDAASAVLGRIGRRRSSWPSCAS